MTINIETAMADIVQADVAAKQREADRVVKEAVSRIVPNPAAPRGHVPWVAIAYAVFAALIWFNMPPAKIGESNQLAFWLLVFTGLPMCTASVRHHHNTLAITVLNSIIFAFLLWVASMAVGIVPSHWFASVVLLLFVPFYLIGAIGWLVALIWSLTAVR
jgi:hypothetical protein